MSSIEWRVTRDELDKLLTAQSQWRDSVVHTRRMGEDSSRMAMTEQFVTVEAGERSMVLDAMALLGGNEYLVQQMIERLSETQYNEAEVAFIRASLSHTWGSVPPDLPGQFTLSQLLTFLTPLHRERLERLLASCLLYCSRCPDDT